MIFYFTGTGNSGHVASELGAKLNDRLVPMGAALVEGNTCYELKPGERVGFVFPTYCWGVPPVVVDFIARLDLQGYRSECNFVYMVATCGDDVGLLVDMMRRLLARRQLELQAAYSVTMPNTYVNMRGFDVDPDLVRDAKLHAAEGRIAELAQSIAEGRVTTDVCRGSWPWLKTRVVYPWFRRHAMSDKKFHVEPGRCTHCGACVKNCPLGNITLNAQGEPQWHGRCTMCESCLHRCPARAIQYGKATQGKGRYYFK